MKLDDIYVLFENNGEYFNSYDKAYYNSKLSSCKKVNYVFTPTMQKCPRVNELYRVARNFFKEQFGCDYYDIRQHQCFTQLSLMKGNLNEY